MAECGIRNNVANRRSVSEEFFKPGDGGFPSSQKGKSSVLAARSKEVRSTPFGRVAPFVHGGNLARVSYAVDELLRPRLFLFRQIIRTRGAESRYLTSGRSGRARCRRPIGDPRYCATTHSLLMCLPLFLAWLPEADGYLVWRRRASI